MSSVSRSVGRPVARSVLAGQLNTLASIIKSLFANNEQGFAYDPNDLSTLYQDATGVIPVTAAGQPVGLMKDKSGRNNHAYQSVSASRPILQQVAILGENLISDGTFTNGSGALPYIVRGTAQWVDGRLRLTTTTVVSGNYNYGVCAASIDPLITKSGKYLLSMDVTARSVANTTHAIHLTASMDQNSSVRTTASSGLTKTGTISYIVDMVGGECITIVTLGGVATIGDYWEIDNISVKEVTGYRTNQNYLKFDGVDDNLITTLPTQLTGCTVVRSVPNVGTQILTGQTIPTPYNDNVDNCGLIVINRALTASETSQITKLFNKAAGV